MWPELSKVFLLQKSFWWGWPSQLKPPTCCWNTYQSPQMYAFEEAVHHFLALRPLELKFEHLLISRPIWSSQDTGWNGQHRHRDPSYHCYNCKIRQTSPTHPTGYNNKIFHLHNFTNWQKLIETSRNNEGLESQTQPEIDLTPHPHFLSCWHLLQRNTDSYHHHQELHVTPLWVANIPCK